MPDKNYDQLIAEIFGMVNSPNKDLIGRLIQNPQGNPFSRTHEQITKNFDVWPEKKESKHPVLGRDTWLIFPKKEIQDKFKGFNPSNIQRFDLYAYFNLLSTLDMSLSVPFMNIKFQSVRPKGSTTGPQEAATNNDLAGINYIDTKFSPAMMENPHQLFFMPQTYFSKKVLGGDDEANLFRPPMAIKSFKVQIKNPFGMIAVEHASMVLKVFDTARLGQISKLIIPAKPDSPIWDIEYGWNHPGISATNPSKNTFAAQFINKLKKRTNYKVTNFNITMNADNTADLSLNMMSTPAEQMTRVHLLEKGDDYYIVEQEEMKKQATRDQKLEELDKKHAKSKKKESWKARKARRKIHKQDKKAISLTDSARSKNLSKALKRKFDVLFDSKANAGVVDKLDKFMAGRQPGAWMKLATTVGSGRYAGLGKKKLEKQFTSLGVLFYYLFRQLSEQNESPKVETQIFFDNFNKNAGAMGGKNIASFVIHYKKMGKKVSSGLIGLMKIYMLSTHQGNPLITDVCDLINEKFIKDSSNFNYGLNFDIFKTDGKDSTGATEHRPKGALPKDFTIPSVKTLILEIPIKKNADEPAKVIRRIFVYDETNFTGTDDISQEIRDMMGGPETFTPEKVEAGEVKLPSRHEMLQVVRERIPYVKIGAERSPIKSLSFSTYNDPMQETVFMQKAQEFGREEDIADKVGGLPHRFFPTHGNLNIWGFPNILFGSVLFLDSRTRSTVDNIYRITGISHNFSPSGIDTNVELTPDSVYTKIMVPFKPEGD